MQFTISVAESPTVQIVLSSNMLDSYVGESSTLTVTLNSIGGYQGDVSLEVLNVPSGVTVNVVPQTLTVSTSTQCNITFQVSNSTISGTYTLTLNVKDSTGNIISQTTFTLNVKTYEKLSAYISASQTIVEVGTTITIYGSATGGKSPYTFQHYINNTYYTNQQNYQYVPLVEGSYLFYVQVTDSLGNAAKSQTLTVKVAKAFDSYIYLYNMSSRLDFNGNGTIDIADVNEISKYFGQKVAKYDIDESGIVDQDDIGIVSGNMGTVFFTASINGEEIYSGILKNETIYIGKYISGICSVSIRVVTEEEATETLTLNSGNNYIHLTLSNPWSVKNQSLSLLFLTGNFVVDLLKVMSLTVIIICVILLVLILKRKE
jgi:hypothetical protein